MALHDMCNWLPFRAIVANIWCLVRDSLYKFIVVYSIKEEKFIVVFIVSFKYLVQIIKASIVKRTSE